MTDIVPSASRARGQAIRTARLARARTIRRRIIAGALALFVAGWLLITLVLVSGHDPALAENSSTTAVASSPSTSSASSSENSASSSENSASSSANRSSSGGVSSVTTSQS